VSAAASRFLDPPSPDLSTGEPTGQASVGPDPIPTAASPVGSAPAPSRPATPSVTAPAREGSLVSAQSAVIASAVLVAALVLLLRAARRRPVHQAPG
jgi:hypothetical protein